MEVVVVDADDDNGGGSCRLSPPAVDSPAWVLVRSGSIPHKT